MCAVQNRTKEIVQLILKCNPDVNYQSTYGNTALILSDDEDISLLLIDAGADINVTNNTGLTALRKAMMTRKKQLAETIVKDQTYDINRVHNKLTDLMWLFMFPYPVSVGQFADSAKSINTDTYSVPLKMDHAYLNWTTSMLLQHPDCDITVVNQSNQSVFHLMHTNLHVLHSLVEHQSYKVGVLNNPDRFGKTFFHNLFGSNAQVQLEESVVQRDKVIDLIVAEFKNTPAVHNLQDCVGNSPLMVATWHCTWNI